MLSVQQSLNLFKSISRHIGFFLVEGVVERLLLRVHQNTVLSKERLGRRNVATSLGRSHLLLDSLLLLLLSFSSLLVELNSLIHILALLFTVGKNIVQVLMSSVSLSKSADLAEMTDQENIEYDSPEDNVAFLEVMGRTMNNWRSMFSHWLLVRTSSKLVSFTLTFVLSHGFFRHLKRCGLHIDHDVLLGKSVTHTSKSIRQRS